MKDGQPANLTIFICVIIGLFFMSVFGENALPVLTVAGIVFLVFAEIIYLIAQGIKGR
jgi:hypothetical protein